jgi:hypothetical protein
VNVCSTKKTCSYQLLDQQSAGLHRFWSKTPCLSLYLAEIEAIGNTRNLKDRSEALCGFFTDRLLGATIQAVAQSVQLGHNAGERPLDSNFPERPL